MNAIPWILLAEHSRPGDAFRGRGMAGAGQETLLGFLILVAVLAGLWALLQISSLGSRRRASRSPLRLFLSLCRAHRLSWSERWLLWRIARARGLKNPAQVFLDPEGFRPVGLQGGLGRKAQRLRQIGARLFAGLPAGQERTSRRAAASPGRFPPGRAAAARPPRPAAETAAPPLPPPVAPPTLDIPPWPDASQTDPAR
jgi:hypothetical protein